MGHETYVWAQTGVLLVCTADGGPPPAAPTPRTSDVVDLSRTGTSWEWIICHVPSGDTSALSSPGTSLVVTVVDKSKPDLHGQSITIPHEMLKPDSFGPKVVLANDVEVASALGNPSPPPDDLVTLTHLHEPAVLFSLKARYDMDCIYTATGPILLALNPFKSLEGLYDDETMTKYWEAGEQVMLPSQQSVNDMASNATNGGTHDLGPHIYQNAHIAFRSMMQGIERQRGSYSTNAAPRVAKTATAPTDQTLLVSGESGAGKTVTTKHVMKYLATLSQRKAEFAKRRRAASPGRSEPTNNRSSMRRVSRALSSKIGALIEEKILESNPILESFGNARTVRNDNSSRFGKFIELQFKQTGSLIGARINTYLLEKVRLVHQADGERNFHIFHEMLAGAEDERDVLLLNDYTAKDFKMTASPSDTYTRRDGIDDAEMFDDLCYSMGTMGFGKNNQEAIFACIAAFLHLSNITFDAPTEDSSRVDMSNKHVGACLELLGLDEAKFQSSMTEDVVEIRNSTFVRQRKVEAAMKASEAFLKGTYDAMFTFIVDTVNKKIEYKPQPGVPNILGKAGSINVLDIFGFETFKLNSFEQLCINYCNETLQQQFNLFIFKSEQEEYEREGIEWDFITFPDNTDVIDLIDKKHGGILSMLTDQCNTPNGTDKLFVEAMYKQYAGTSRFVGTPLQRGKGEFIISHYAGPVKYNADGFVEKNKDETPNSTVELLQSSSKDFIRMLGEMMAAKSDKGFSKNKRSKKRPTVASQFSTQLADLRRKIDETSPHYIRCLKPNQSLEANTFNSGIIADQLRYAGVLEAIRISRVGFSQRYLHEKFMDRYQFLVPNADDVETVIDAIAEKVCRNMTSFGSSPVEMRKAAGIAKGDTKVFLRQHAFEYLESFRNEHRTLAASVIQRRARGFVVRCNYLRTREHIVRAQAGTRRFLSRKVLLSARKRRAAVKIQKYSRMSQARKVYYAKKASAQFLQRYYRGQIDRKRYKKLYEEAKRKAAMSNLQYRSAVVIQCMYRINAAKTVYRAMKSIERRPSQVPVKLEGKALKEAIKSDKAAAIARQSAFDKEKEIGELQSRLAGAANSEEKALSVREELEAVKGALQVTMAEIEVLKLSHQAATNRAEKLEEENKRLKERLAGGNVEIEDDIYANKMYNDHPDLRQLDERMKRMVSRSKKSKADTKALVQSLAILRS